MAQLDLFGSYTDVQQPKIAEKKIAVTVALKTELLQDKEVAPEKEQVAAVTETVAFEKKPIKENPLPASTRNKRGRKSFKEMDADIVMVEVPDDDILFQKQYYAISEVAEWFHVNQSLLRYWENEFAVLKPRKTRKGDRLFRPEDVKNLQLIYYLLRERKFSIEGARQYIKDNGKKVNTQMQLIQSLTKFRAFLLEWKANLGA
ncbi:MAG: MerR family transcriptional regulator [Panacibacter sp.]